MLRHCRRLLAATTAKKIERRLRSSDACVARVPTFGLFRSHTHYPTTEDMLRNFRIRITKRLTSTAEVDVRKRGPVLVIQAYKYPANP